MPRKRWNDVRTIEDLRPKPEKEISVVVSAKTPGQKRYIQSIQENDIVFCHGPAGTGKTAISVGIGLQAVLGGKFQKLVIMRPAKEACDEKIGYLPGDQETKMAVWIAPVTDNMEVFVSKQTIKSLLCQGKIEVLPLAFARGRSLNNSYIICDESQNLNPPQVLMVLTRLGNGSKMVLNGDLQQSDLNGNNGLADAIRRLAGINGISFVELGEEDMVRHPLLREIVSRYASKPSCS